MSQQLCPNCKARFIGYNDHDLGKPTPNRWLCDEYTVIYEQPVVTLTYQAGQLIRSFLLTHPDPSAKKLADVFDKE